jgi:ATP-dependent DNA helicase RecG
MLTLDQDITYVPGVGPRRAELLNKELGIRTVGDLLDYFPYKYVDRSRFYRIAEINGTMPYVQLYGQILSFESEGEGRGRRLVAHFGDGTGIVDLVWFQGAKYIAKTYDTRTPYVVFGKPQPYHGRYNIAHPEIEKPDSSVAEMVRRSAFEQQLFDRQQASAGVEQELFPTTDDAPAAPEPQHPAQPHSALRPAYNTTERMKRGMMQSNVLSRIVSHVLSQLAAPFEETLPASLVERLKLMSHDEAMRNIHFPASADSLRRAQSRLKFEELFYVQLNILRYAKARDRKYRGLVFSRVGDAFNGFYFHHLPFQLTNAQKRVIREIRTDMGSGRQMNRLLQGDVGCGKTLVALMCALLAVDNGCQTCIMAPTEILAEQHLATLRQLLGDMPVRVELLTGSVKGKARKRILDDLQAGHVHILVGTHAVIEENVLFAHLGLVVIDEQHRFGVAQRARLWQKNVVPPHVLVMTATPIPRTLAMTLYGDLDVSVIDELPPGRKPIRTIHQFDAHRRTLNEHIRRQIQLGRQVYIVYPLIKESEKMDIKNLEAGFAQVKTDFPECSVSMVHGKLKPAEKDAEMQRFVRGETQIMVATTVIEVGVNVPNASVMVIENAERFGLSQLHQLRGRVGRGAEQSFCILVTKYQLSDVTRKRIQVMVDSNDGFEIAEQDLKLRGPGDLEGTQQSGMAFNLRIANLAKDGILLQMARNEAAALLDADPAENHPENAVAWQRLQQLRKTHVDWSAIS